MLVSGLASTGHALVRSPYQAGSAGLLLGLLRVASPRVVPFCAPRGAHAVSCVASRQLPCINCVASDALPFVTSFTRPTFSLEVSASVARLVAVVPIISDTDHHLRAVALCSQQHRPLRGCWRGEWRRAFITLPCAGLSQSRRLLRLAPLPSMVRTLYLYLRFVKCCDTTTITNSS